MTSRTYIGPTHVSPDEPLHRHTERAVSYITISRQIGAGALNLAQELADALNRAVPPGQQRWSAWDRELIEKTAHDFHMSVDEIERLEESGYSFMDTFISALGGLPEELGMIRRLEQSACELATEGRVILIGHGSAFMTHDVAGGLHVRLVAPWRARVHNFSERMHLHLGEAEKRLHHSERTWNAFLKRYWPNYSLAPEIYDATLNTGVLDDRHLVRAIASLVAP